MRQDQLAETAIHSKPVIVTGAAGASTALAPTEAINQVAGNYLATHGIGVLSYTEIIQVAGAVWVSFLIVDYLIKGIRGLKRIKGRS